MVSLVNNGLLINFGSIGRTNTNGVIAVNFPCSFTTNMAVAISTKPGDSDTAVGRFYSLTSTYNISYFHVCNNGWTTNYNGITGKYVAIGY